MLRNKLKEIDLSQSLIFLILLALLFTFILYPLIRVLYVAFTEADSLSLSHFINFFERALFKESFLNSLSAGLMAVIFGSLISLPLAFFTIKYDFKGRTLIQTLGILPLVMPPFVGAVALQLILGRSGVFNLLLLKWFGTSVPFMEGLRGVIIVQTLHYFPFIFLNASASLANVDPSLEEMAQNMGSHGLRLFRRVTLPLMMPGYVAGILLVFIRVIDDLGTPLMLNYTKMLAPQAYLRVTTIGVEDKAGYVICVIMVVLSLLSLWGAMKFLSLSEYAMVQRGGAGTPISKKIGGWRLVFVLVFCFFVLGVSLLPHLGIFVLSFAKVWSFSILPKSYTLNHYVEIFFRTPHFVKNTLLYCLLAAGIDVLLGSVIAFLLIRGKVFGKGLLDAIATMPLAIPGVVLATGYLRVFHGTNLPFFHQPLTSLWIILVIAYSARRLPYTLRSCYASIQQIHISLEEAALNLGANRRKTFFRITFPLMTGGLIAGGLLAFITSSVELASTIMLVPRMEYGPLSYGIYIYMQSAVGRGPGAALGVVAILLVATGTYLVNRVFAGGSGTAFKL
ncbi:MAG: iron ABC transporter permease [Syntrophaceae bacterium]|nr:iron ABC transporter permease [Syntrophaceae bacterium]